MQSLTGGRLFLVCPGTVTGTCDAIWTYVPPDDDDVKMSEVIACARLAMPVAGNVFDDVGSIWLSGNLVGRVSPLCICWSLNAGAACV